MTTKSADNDTIYNDNNGANNENGDKDDERITAYAIYDARTRARVYESDDDV